MKKNWEQIITYVTLSQPRQGKDTKLAASIKKISKSLIEIQKVRDQDKADEIEEERISLCSVDVNANILRDASGNKCFTKENEKALRKALKAIEKKYEDQTYEIKPCICTEPPADLTEDEIEAFKGFIIAEDFAYPKKSEESEDEDENKA